MKVIPATPGGAPTNAFVGRAQELGLLRARLEQAKQGRGRVVFLSAEAGAGKSTLIERFLAEVPDRLTDALVVRGSCSEQYGAGEPFQPFVEAFRHLAAEMEDRRERSFGELAREIAPFWLAAIPVAGEAMAAGMATASELQRASGKDRSLKEMARDIAPLWVSAIPVAGEALAAGMATATELRATLRGGGPRSVPSEEALFFQYTQFFLAASDERPIVLFIDDLHWADRASVSLLTHLARQVADRRVLILGSYRPVDLEVSDHPMLEARQELEGEGVAEEVSLGPLDRQALGGLIRSRKGVPGTRRLLDWLERRGGSNALFFEELLDWLEHQGFARTAHGELELVEVPPEVEIPRSAEGTIEKRLDRLDEETRRILEYASVDGNEFDSVSLSRLLDMKETELEGALEPLVRVHRLVHPKETRALPDDQVVHTYEFSHSLIQNVLHAGLHGRRRILLHRKMGEILEDIWDVHAQVVAHKLAIHFEEGRQPEKAFQYAMAAAERARQVYAHWDALDQIERALRNAGTEEQRSEAHQRLGEAYLAIGRYAEATDALEEALERVDGDEKRALRLRHQRLLAQRNQGVRPVGELLEDMESLRQQAHRLGEWAEECRIIWHLIDLPGTTEAVDVVLAREALELAYGLEDPWLAARGRMMLGVSLVFEGRPGEAVEILTTAREVYAGLDDRNQEAACRVNLALAHIFLGNYQRAAAELTDAVRIADDIVDPDRSSTARINLARVLTMTGNYGPAEQAMYEALRIGERLSSPACMLSPLHNLAEMNQERREWDAAEAWWRELLAKAEATGYVNEQIVGRCGIGMVRVAQGDIGGAVDAERAARERLGSDAEMSSESREAVARLSIWIAAATGETEGALALLRRLLEDVEGIEPFMAALYRLEAAELLYHAAPADACELAQEAREIFNELGVGHMVRRTGAIIDGKGQYR